MGEPSETTTGMYAATNPDTTYLQEKKKHARKKTGLFFLLIGNGVWMKNRLSRN
jgi:hypothetical protein